MKHTFYKYQGTGNDFVIIDNRQDNFDKTKTKLINQLCDRRFGIGADGLILLEDHELYDFKMVYFNADGNESSMCGNGGRCISHFAQYLNIIDNQAVFEAIDGLHHVKIENDIVQLQMQDVNDIAMFSEHTFLDTGSPHHVQMCADTKGVDVKTTGAEIRFGAPYGNAGTNVNFVQAIAKNTFAVRTYERGVEDETLSCGTGVTAVALAMHLTGKVQDNLVTLETEGGKLKVSFEKNDSGYHNIWLIGPATLVFKGEIGW